MSRITVSVVKDVPVKYLKVSCEVRYWEGTSVNGIEDEDGLLIPFRNGTLWQPVIDIEDGSIKGWPKGTEASINYKVCDNGTYTLIGDDGQEVCTLEGYVPDILCPVGDGYGDYIIMNIDCEGNIDQFDCNLTEFEIQNS